MAILTLAAKDLRLLLRDPRSAVILLVTPLFLIVVLYFALGEGFGEKPDERLRISVVNLDRGLPGTSDMYETIQVLTYSSGPWTCCMPVKRLGQGIPISVRREPSVPPRTGCEWGAMPMSRQAARARSTGRMSFSSQ